MRELCEERSGSRKWEGKGEERPSYKNRGRDAGLSRLPDN